MAKSRPRRKHRPVQLCSLNSRKNSIEASVVIEDLYSDKLKRFKQSERPEVVLLLADNPDLVRIIVAWTSLDTTHANKISDPLVASESEVWEWLWDNTTYSLREVFRQALMINA